MRDPFCSPLKRLVLLVLLALLLAATASCAGTPAGQATATEAAFAATGSVQDQLAQLAASAGAQATEAVTPGASATGAMGSQAEQPPTPSVAATRTRRPAATASVKSTRTPRVAQTPSDGLPTIALAKLPPEARETIRLIQQGGPFPYARDGVTFQNREGRLPKHPSGYYREYTVVTPGSPDRGARRIIAGAEGELYYTADHYDTFKRVILP